MEAGWRGGDFGVMATAGHKASREENRREAVTRGN